MKNDLIIMVTVKTGRAQEKVFFAETQLTVWVKAQKERGRANEALRELLSKVLDIAKSTIEIISGHTAPKKKIRICNCTIDEFTRKVNTFCN